MRYLFICDKFQKFQLVLRNLNMIESIDWVLEKNVDITGPAASVRWNSLSMRRESFSSRVWNSFCSWATIRDNFFVNRVVQPWNSFPDNIVTFPFLNSFKSSIDEHFKRFFHIKLTARIILSIMKFFAPKN